MGCGKTLQGHLRAESSPRQQDSGDLGPTATRN